MSKIWGLKLIISKCWAMRLYSKRCPLPVSCNSPHKIRNDIIKLLSVQSDIRESVDRNLKFYAHVNKTVRLVGHSMTNMFTCTFCILKDFMLSLYVSHTRLKFEYAAWKLGYIGDSNL